METLFPVSYPEGFTYTPAFISIEEEQQLLTNISSINLHTFPFQGYEAKRKVASFGYDYSFTNRSLTKGNDIPASFQFLIERVAQRLAIEPKNIAELLITEYPPGSVINWHRDAPPFDLIAGISLQSDCTFKLRPHEKEIQNRKNIVSLTVSRRSLYVIQGLSRSEWQHSIAPVTSTRYSITLRTLKTNQV